ncbi:MAG TPA: creatininase family protein [Nitrososphaera sp.]|nr:creatininase family protein [Nitrososphaera sp.]
MSIPVFGMSDPDFKSALRKTKKAILPIGSLEQHGPHLPVSTDSLITEHIARMVAERTGAFVLPVMTYGVSFEHKPMFNVSIRHTVFSEMISDACASLAENGIKQIILLNGHHGNMGALQYTSQGLHGRVPKDVHVNTIHYWHMLEHEFDHAGEVETSLVLAIASELVDMKKAVPNSNKLSKSKVAYGTMTNAPGSFPKITGNGVWGDPRKASETKGKQWLERVVVNLTRTISELS